jgi:hypothetical protein
MFRRIKGAVLVSPISFVRQFKDEDMGERSHIFYLRPVAKVPVSLSTPCFTSVAIGKTL